MKVWTLCIHEIVTKKVYTKFKKPNHILKVLYSHSKEKQKLMVLVIFTGKRQLRLNSNVSRANNRWLEQLERFYSRNKMYHPKSLFHFNYYFCPNCSLLRKHLILMIVNYSNFKWFTPRFLLHHFSKRNNPVLI